MPSEMNLSLPLKHAIYWRKDGLHLIIYRLPPFKGPIVTMLSVSSLLEKANTLVFSAVDVNSLKITQ